MSIVSYPENDFIHQTECLHGHIQLNKKGFYTATRPALFCQWGQRNFWHLCTSNGVEKIINFSNRTSWVSENGIVSMENINFVSNNEENDVKTIVGPFSCGANIQSGGRIQILGWAQPPQPPLALGLFLYVFHEKEWLDGHIQLRKNRKKMTSVYLELTSLRSVNSEKLGQFFPRCHSSRLFSSNN